MKDYSLNEPLPHGAADMVAEIFGTANSNKPPREDVMASPERLWFRCYEAADEFLEALDRALKDDGGPMGQAAAFLAVVDDHVMPLTDAVHAVKEHEAREALREDLAYEGAFRGPL